MVTKEKIVKTLKSGKIELFNRWRELYKVQTLDLSGANLRWANLSGANLRWANLSGANLSGADLRWANSIYTFNKEGGRVCYAVVHPKGLMIQAGCFWGTLDEFEAKANQTHTDPIQAYAPQIAYLRAIEATLAIRK